VTFAGKSPGVVLAGTLTLPRQNAEKYPAVILVSGSGPQDRNQEFFDHKPFLVIADYLTRAGSPCCAATTGVSRNRPAASPRPPLPIFRTMR
jgi:hypothetical protein